MFKVRKAKNFQSVNFNETIFDCYKYQGNDFLLLIFYRGAWCGYCRKQLNELNKYYEDFEKLEVKVLAISSDSLLNTSLLFNITKSRFPLLADPDYKIFKLFNLPKVKDKKKVKPAIFLINPAKQIVYSYVGKDYRDRPGIRELKKTINQEIKKTINQ